MHAWVYDQDAMFYTLTLNCVDNSVLVCVCVSGYIHDYHGCLSTVEPTPIHALRTKRHKSLSTRSENEGGGDNDSSSLCTLIESPKRSLLCSLACLLSLPYLFIYLFFQDRGRERKKHHLVLKYFHLQIILHKRAHVRRFRHLHSCRPIFVPTPGYIFFLISTSRSASSQKVIGHGLLGRHAPRVLRRGLKDAIAPRGPAGLCDGLFRHDAGGSAVTAVDVTVAARNDAGAGTVVAELHNGCNVAAAVAVIGRRPDGDDGVVEHFLEAFHNELVSTRDHRKVVAVVENFDNIGAEEKACASRRETPAVDLVGIGPQEVAHGSLVRNFLLPIQ